MKPNRNLENQSIALTQEPYTTNSVISADGTLIGYRQVGHGPGLLLVHGGLESAESHQQLADELSKHFTVYLSDRRGRGMSGPFGGGYTIQKEVEDIEALFTKTDTHSLFGLSSGAIICLQTALTLPTVQKVAIYEPPLSINGSFSLDWVKEFDREIEQGDVAEALVVVTKGTQQFGHTLPHWLLKGMARLLLGDMLALVPTFHYDAQLVLETRDTWQNFKHIQANVLLLGGSKSPTFLKTALDTLEELLPHVKRVEFAGLNHGGSGNKNRGGRPTLVAAEMYRFFTES
jgi:pimeloyl-ACP methyl ester carboxylesterase